MGENDHPHPRGYEILRQRAGMIQARMAKKRKAGGVDHDDPDSSADDRWNSIMSRVVLFPRRRHRPVTDHEEQKEEV